MVYRRRTQMSQKLSEARTRAGCLPREPLPQLPALRRVIVIQDFDFGLVEHRIELYRTNRIDVYRAVADGKPWKDRIGWARVLEAIRKSFIRVGAA